MVGFRKVRHPITKDAHVSPVLYYFSPANLEDILANLEDVHTNLEDILANFEVMLANLENLEIILANHEDILANLEDILAYLEDILTNLEDILFLVGRTAVEGDLKDGRAPASLAAELGEGGDRVLARQVLAACHRYHTLQI